ncbi:MAG: cytosine permease [Proteobacteria bacterium]|nr:cytosine permease [Pseudomonadota bacterium]
MPHPESPAHTMLLEHRSIDYIPLAERHGKVWHLWPVWFSGDAHLATLAAGVVGIVLGENLLWTAVAVTLGSALGTCFMAFHSAQGPQLGLPQMIQSRPQFGYRGALLVWVVALVAYVGYNAFNQILAAQAFHQLAPSVRPDSGLTIVAFNILAVSLAIVGYDLIHIAQRWIAFIMIGMLVLFTAAIGFHNVWPAGAFDVHAFRGVPFLAALFAAAAYQLSWSIYVSDYSRYLPRDVSVRAAFWWTFIGAFVGGTWMLLVGAVAAALIPVHNIAEAMQRAADAALPGLGTPLVIASMLGLVTITSLNFYGASLTLLGIASSFGNIRLTVAKRLASLILLSLVATSIALLASHDFVNAFEVWLTVLLYLFTPWTAINLVDFYCVRRGHYSVREIFNPHGLYGLWNWRGLLAYAVGFVAMIPFFSTQLYRGPVARALGGADVAMLVGLPVASLVYLWACRSLNLAEDRRLAEAADAGLQ